MATEVKPAVETPFVCRAVSSGPLVSTQQGGTAFQVSGWNDDRMVLPDHATHYGVVLEGTARLCGASGDFQLRPGMYFAQPGPAALDGQGRGIVISEEAFVALFHLGGPIENTGRLRYIDGCSDTLLIAPAQRGDACLNLLHLPPGTRQTPHTHPSFRAGVVIAGRGSCRTEQDQYALEPGSLFFIEADGLHCFHTETEPLLIVAFHPDSDFGPVDDDHPMMNRTLIDGVSASRLPKPHGKGAKIR